MGVLPIYGVKGEERLTDLLYFAMNKNASKKATKQFMTTS